MYMIKYTYMLYTLVRKYEWDDGQSLDGRIIKGVSIQKLVDTAKSKFSIFFFFFGWWKMGRSSFN